jgi:GMP synthase-like glutamine amidotransferase
VEQGRPVLGVCLGAQLLAQAMGGNVYKGTVLEIGPGSVRLTAAGRADKVFSAAAESLPVMHWHQDTFTLPPGATHLAGSELYPHQAFRVGRLGYGLQFHIEVDEELAAGWAPHLPATVSLDAAACSAIAAAGKKVLARFFDAAMTMHTEEMR